jgi:hypothetical protein
MSVLTIASIKDTALWKRLNDFSGSDSDVAAFLATNLIAICEEAADRMRSFPSLHPQYTLHDERHLLRVTELMARVLPTEVLSKVLNPVEIALLILSAYFHDQGMVLEKGEIAALDADGSFRIFRDNWEIEHPNLREVKERLSEKSVTGPAEAALRQAEQELLAGLLTDFVRQTHGTRSAELVRTKCGSDPRWTVAGTNIAGLVAKLALSHVRPARELSPSGGFRYDESVGTYRVNMRYLGMVLRVADILDLDRDRTPDSLYRTIDFKSRVSLAEWEKHRSVEGWAIEPGLVQFTMQCEHPEYQRAAYEFMGWIDYELTETAGLAREFPSAFAEYKWHLPLKTDRSRIEPKGNSYIFNDLEFTLSRNEVVKLLMMDRLYSGPWLCVRELLQNALDALRYRRAMFNRDAQVDWTHGKVEFKHWLNNDGDEVLRCTDNGSGMDLKTILGFLTKVGRSYYRSPEFDQERLAFRSAGVDFDPCAQFGIGFMSCFMIGDRIRIQTRRDYGYGGAKGDPLIVEINGLSGMVVVRKGDAGQPVGTAVEITARSKPEFFDPWFDRVRLVPVLDGYALACEFPIDGTCTIPGIAGSASVPTGIADPPTDMEIHKIKHHVTLEQRFSEINPLLNGVIRTSFLTDPSGSFSTENAEAGWDMTRVEHFQGAALKLPTGDYVAPGSHFQQVCLDGILVAGEPGRSDRHKHVLGVYYSPVMSRAGRFVLDIRGELKPPLTPARRPPDNARGPREEPRWKKIQLLVTLAEGRIWEQVAARCFDRGEPELFWKLAMIYHAPLTSMRAKSIWNHIAFPVVSQGSGKCEWSAPSSLGVLSLRQGEGATSGRFTRSDGSVIELPAQVSKWTARSDTASFILNQLVLSTSMVTADAAGIRFVPSCPAKPEAAPDEFEASPIMPGVDLLPYGGDLSACISCHSGFRTANRMQPLARKALESNFLQQPSNLHKFATSLVALLSDYQSAAPRQTPPDITLESLLQGPPKNLPLRCKYVGALFRGVDWQSVPSEYAPPYSVRLESGKTVQVTSEVLERWATAEIGEM